jgi:succinate dehydrogenase flavin-adding protein (antitoxin of CptAB toxin-antitoxin module)
MTISAKSMGSQRRKVAPATSFWSCTNICLLLFAVLLITIIATNYSSTSRISVVMPSSHGRSPDKHERTNFKRLVDEDVDDATGLVPEPAAHIFKELLDEEDDETLAALLRGRVSRADSKLQDVVRKVAQTSSGREAVDIGSAAAAAAQSLVMNSPEGESPVWQPRRQYKAFWFTMDSLQSYIDNAQRGGPAGEITVRNSLTAALAKLNVDVEEARSDDEFESMTNHDVDRYDLFFFDPWTYVGPGTLCTCTVTSRHSNQRYHCCDSPAGWIPRSFLPGRESRTFLVSFFGMRQVGNGFELPLNHVLTPYPCNPDNTFVGFTVEPKWAPRFQLSVHFEGRTAEHKHEKHSTRHGGHSHDETAPVPALPILPPKRNIGIVWGKLARYFDGKEGILRAASAVAELHIVADLPGFNIPNVVQHGHLGKEDWEKLLSESKFLLGLGDPLSGPSALDALAAGCAVIIPTYTSPKEEFFMSQHPFLQEYVGAPYVCTYALEDTSAARRCVESVVQRQEDLAPYIPDAMLEEQHLIRVRNIVAPVLDVRL